VWYVFDQHSRGPISLQFLRENLKATPPKVIRETIYADIVL
jgi:hypothetical protein